MWAHEAARLILNLHHYWEVDRMVDPPRVRSAVHAFYTDRKAEIEEQKVMSMQDLATLGVTVKEV
jgi:hypothetical protein